MNRSAAETEEQTEILIFDRRDAILLAGAASAGGGGVFVSIESDIMSFDPLDDDGDVLLSCSCFFASMSVSFDGGEVRTTQRAMLSDPRTRPIAWRMFRRSWRHLLSGLAQCAVGRIPCGGMRKKIPVVLLSWAGWLLLPVLLASVLFGAWFGPRFGNALHVGGLDLDEPAMERWRRKIAVGAFLPGYLLLGFSGYAASTLTSFPSSAAFEGASAHEVLEALCG